MSASIYDLHHHTTGVSQIPFSFGNTKIHTCKLIHLFCVCWIDMVWQILIIVSSMYSVHLRLYNLIVFKASLNPTKLKFSVHLKVSLSSAHRFCICETGVTKRNFYDSSIDIQIRSLTMIYELLCWYNINTVVLQNLF